MCVNLKEDGCLQPGNNYYSCRVRVIQQKIRKMEQNQSQKLNHKTNFDERILRAEVWTHLWF